MKCSTVKLDNGVTAIVCGRDRRGKCSQCGRLSTKLCDFPQPNGKTCDKKLCGHCAVPIGPDMDYCPDHQRTAAPQAELAL
jgi:hypothetical protein